MRQTMVVTFILVFLLAPGSTNARELPPLEVAPFGTVRLYMPQEPPSHVVILLSGEKGWDDVAEKLITRMTALGCLAIGVDARDYLSRLVAGKTCTYPASDFENLSRFVQQKVRLAQYTQPVLAGYSLGSALVYATLVQAPVNIFAGGISMGFCPEAPLTAGVCKGLGLDWSPEDRHLLPAPELRTPWIVLPQPGGKDCSVPTDAFLAQVKGVTILAPPPKEESTAKDAPPKDPLIPAFTILAANDHQQASTGASSSSVSLKDLPLVEIPAEKLNVGPSSDHMVVFISGDGGWAGLDHEVGNALAKQGIPVVGLNSLRYFWNPKTPEKTAMDVALILRHYLASWKKAKAILIGYSFGADVLPFVVNRLPEDLKARVDRVVLMGPSLSAQFQFHLSNWFEGESRDSIPTLPEAQHMKSQNILCIYGKEEGESLCPSLDPSHAARIMLPGGHHFDGNYPAIAAKILTAEFPAPTVQ